MARAEEVIIDVLCRCWVGGAELAGEKGLAFCVRLGALAGIVAYHPVALMKEAFVVSPYPR